MALPTDARDACSAKSQLTLIMLAICVSNFCGHWQMKLTMCGWFSVRYTGAVAANPHNRNAFLRAWFLSDIVERPQLMLIVT